MISQALSLTPAAVDRIRYLIETQGDGAKGVQVGVSTAGCSGMSYTIEFVETIEPSADLVEVDGVKVVIDPKAVMYLVGTEMDFVEDKLGSAFKFKNPNEAGRCGCGESFTV